MDCSKAGRLLQSLRREQGLTQKQLAGKLHISDKTISKWECGMGFPDVSVLGELAEALGIDVRRLLDGELPAVRADGGNMKRLRFYACPICGNVLTATGEAAVSCCGRSLQPLIPQPCDEGHRLDMQPIEDEWYIRFAHEMSKEHFIRFVAYVTYDRVMLVRLYPEQSGEMRLPQMHGGQWYIGCSRDGLFVQK